MGDRVLPFSIVAALSLGSKIKGSRHSFKKVDSLFSAFDIEIKARCSIRKHAEPRDDYDVSV